MTSKCKILILSSTGQLGREISEQFQKISEVININRKDCDFNDFIKISHIIESQEPNVIINCSGYTNVNGAENKKKEAININKNFIKHLAKISNKVNSLLIHFSTDYVFDGLKMTPYVEEDLPNPINFYGFSKYEGEKILTTNCNRYILIRTSWMHSETEGNFVRNIINLLDTKDFLEVVDDQYGSPTSARIIAKILKSMINVNDNLNPIKLENQTYHITTEGIVTWHGIAKEIIFYLKNNYKYKKKIILNNISSGDRTMDVKRPLYSKLSTQKIRQSLAFDIPLWTKDLHDTIDKIIKNNHIKF